MSNDRRMIDRCPVCQGPMKEHPSKKGELKCRNSLCTYNHQEVDCPRCGQHNVQSVQYANGAHIYNCRSCMNRWEID